MLRRREPHPALDLRHWYGGDAPTSVVAAEVALAARFDGGWRPRVSLPFVASVPVSIAMRTASLALIVLAAAAGVGVLIGIRGASAALLVPVVLAALLLVARPEVGMLFMAATLPLEGATLLGGEVTAGRALGILVGGAWALHRLWRRQPWNRVLSGALPKLCLVFACYAGLSLSWSIYDGGGIAPLLRLAQLVILAILLADLGGSWDTIDQIAKAVLLGTLVAAVLILLQFQTGLVSRAGEGITGGNANTAGRVLVTAFPFAFYLVGSTRKPFWRIVAIVYLAAATLGVAVTFSRTSFLLLPVVVVLCLFRLIRSRRAMVWMLVPVMTVALSIGILPSDRLNARIATIGGYVEDTFRPIDSGNVSSSRGYHLRIALAIVGDHPIFGAGYDSYGRGFLDYQLEVPGAKKLWLSPRSPHSSHAGLLADLGLTGIILWSSLFITGLAYTIVSSRSMPGTTRLAQHDIAFALAIAILLQLLYGFAADVHEDKLLWLLFGLAIAVRRLGLQERALTVNRLAAS